MRRLSVIGFTRRKHSGQPAFTLAELLIALLILGEIATFTIPKVLISQQNGQWKSEAKELIGSVSAAYQSYQLNNTVTGNTNAYELTPYLNFVAIDTVTNLDDNVAGGSNLCNGSTRYCVKLHNGGTLLLYKWFGGLGATNSLWFMFDPDSTYTGKGDSLWFVIYPNGFTTSRANIYPNTIAGNDAPRQPNATLDPAWFNWN